MFAWEIANLGIAVRDNHEMLRQYGRCSIELARRLKETILNTEEQMYLEHHVLTVQLALAMSKQARPKRPVPVRGE